MADEDHKITSAGRPSHPKIVIDAAVKSGILRTDAPLDTVLQLGNELDLEADYVTIWRNYAFIVKEGGGGGGSGGGTSFW
jgi:hypothetical protein